MALSRVRLIRVRLVLINLNPINDTYIQASQFRLDVHLPFKKVVVLDSIF